MAVDLVDVAEALAPCKRAGARELEKRESRFSKAQAPYGAEAPDFPGSGLAALLLCFFSTKDRRDDSRGPKGEWRMSAVKIGASRQVIIPKKVYEELGLAAGDYLDVQVRDGNLLMSPKTLVDKPTTNHRGGNDDA
jgi:AbrB family looped-hinge helix DNA binding protein